LVFGSINGVKKYSSAGLINNNRLFAILIVLLSLTAIFCYTVGTVSADSSRIYVNNNTGNDSWDGQNPTWNGTSGPKLSIKNATGTVVTDGTVNLANGIYNGPDNRDITLDKNMIIQGESSEKTIIDAQYLGRLFTVNSGVTVIIQEVTIMNGLISGSSAQGGAIYNSGTLTVNNVTFSGNNATVKGGAIYNWYGILTVNGCTFINNSVTYIGMGGAICNDFGNFNMNNCNFTNNSGYWGGAIGTTDYSSTTQNISDSSFTNNYSIGGGSEVGGGAIYHSAGNLIVTNCIFTGNTAIDYGGAILHYYANNLTVTNCTFTGNSANAGGGAIATLYNIGNMDITGSIFTDNAATNGRGGALYHARNMLNVHFCRFFNNNAYHDIGTTIYLDFFYYTGTIDATNNWWGTNSNPKTIPGLIVGGSDDSVNVNPWIMLTINSAPSMGTVGGTSTVTADLIHNSLGEDTSSLGLVPTGGIPLQFGNDFRGSLTINDTTFNSTNQVTTGFTGLAFGLSTVNATFDNQTVQTGITILGRDEVYVSPTGNDDTGDGSPTNPFLTILKGVNNTYADGKLYIANGTYLGILNNNITINRNLSIFGESQTGTIIDAQNSGRIFLINSGINVTIQNLTFKNGNATDSGGAIYNYGNLTLNNCSFTNNTQSLLTNAGGGAIMADHGILTVNNCNFLNNWAHESSGAIAGHYSSVTINGSTFNGNSAISGSGGAINNYQGTLSVNDSNFTYNTADQYGGAINNDGGTLTVNNSTFTNNTATHMSGGAISGSTLTVNGSTFINNTASNYDGGAIGAGTSTITCSTFINNHAYRNGGVITTGTANINFCRFVNNTAPGQGSTILCYSGSVNAENNWWGSNSSPSGEVYGNVDYGPWIVLTINVTPSTVSVGGTSTVTSDLIHNSLGEDTSSLGLVPTSGIHLQFGNDFRGSLTITSTTFNSTNQANTVFTGLAFGLSTVNVTFDNQTVQTGITILGRDEVYVSPTGNDDDGDGSPVNPFLTIFKGVNNTYSDGKLYIANGTYTGTLNKNITISRNLSIFGEIQPGTIIDAENIGTIFLIDSGINVTIVNITFVNGNSTIYGGAIYNNGNLTVTNGMFSNNTATNWGGAIYNDLNAILTIENSVFSDNNVITYGGGAIYKKGGTLDLNNCIFTNNTANFGGAISNSGGMDFTVINCVFTNNTATNGAGGALNNYFTTQITVNNCTFTGNNATSSGGAINTNGAPLNVVNCTFISNSADHGGAILNCYQNNPLIINNCIFNNNKATNLGGAIENYLSITIITNSTIINNTATYGSAIWHDGGTTTVHFTRFVGNTASQGSVIHCYSGSVNAENNWWASNNSPSSKVYGSVDYSPWIVLTINATPSTVTVGGTSTVTADLTYNNFGEDTSSLGLVPTSGIPLQFGNDSLGNLTITNTTFNSTNQATTVFTGLTFGLSMVNDTFDNQTVQTGINILGRDDVYVSPSGNDDNDGSQENPFLTISKGVLNTYSNGMLHIANGTYTGTLNKNITISRNLSILGESLSGTVIDAQNSGRIFLINSGVNVTIQNLTLINGSIADEGGTIYNSGNLTVTDCNFVNNSATSGGAIRNYGNSIVTNSNFTHNAASDRGGAISNRLGNLTVTNCQFSFNTGTLYSGAIDNSGGVMHVINSTFTNNTVTNGHSGAVGGSTVNVSGCTFINNTASIDGGALGAGTSTINSCTFLNNRAGRNGGAISTGDSTVHFCRFVGNNAPQLGSTFYCYSGSVNAENNWWGSNSSPSGKIYGAVDYNPWLVLKISATPTTITTYGTSSVVADLTWNSENKQPTGGFVHNVKGFDATFSVSPTGRGTFNPVTGPISNGKANSTFTASYTSGSVTVSAKVDTQTVSTTITINLPSRNDIYVATTGSDTTGDGSQEHPYKTIQTGYNAVNTNGRIHIANGIYSGTGNKAITIGRSISIFGESQEGTIINAENSGRIFTINSGCTVTIQNLTLRNGNAQYASAIHDLGTLTVTNCTFTANTVTGGTGSGALNVDHGTLTVNDCTFTNNISNNSGALNNYYGVLVTVNNCIFTNNAAVAGGAINNDHSTMTVTNCTFIGNNATSSTASGGAVNNAYGTLTINNSTFTNNNARFSYGAAINNHYGISLNLNNCTFTGNIAKGGGALNSYNSGLTVTNCILTNNSATGGNGGAVNIAYGTFAVDNSTFTNNTAKNTSGGAITNYYGTSTLNNCSFTSNTALGGGAIHNDHGTLTATNCTSTDNHATGGTGSGGAMNNAYGTLTVNNSTFTNNTSNNNGGAINNHYGTSIVNTSTFVGNSAVMGGAINSNYDGAVLNATSCIFTGNSATSATFGGGAIRNYNGTSTIVNSNFTNNVALNGGAIYNLGNYNANLGNLTLTNCTFTSNNANTYGGAIENYYGILTSTNSTFTNNCASAGGSIHNQYGQGTINNCTFTDNIALNGGGGAIANHEALLIVNTSTFNGNNATASTKRGGAIQSYNGQLIVNTSDFSGNNANMGGAIGIWGNATINFCRIIENTATQGSGIYFNNTQGGSVNAENNWWGTNTNPKDVPGLIGGTNAAAISAVDTDPWIVLTISADPSSIPTDGSSNITADLLHDNHGDPVSGVVPYNGPAHFATNLGSIADDDFSDGIATSQLDGGSVAGHAHVSAYVDGASIETLVDVGHLSVIDIIPVDGATDVNQDQEITVTFSEDIQAGTNYQGITVRTLSGQGYSITKNIVDDQLIITGRWTPGTTFEIVIPKNSIQDLSGNQIAATYTSTFTASEGPLVESFDPSNGSTNVDPNKQIVVTFNEDIQAGTNYQGITVRTLSGKGYGITKNIVGNQLFITGRWTRGTTFEIVIPRNAVRDMDGNGNANMNVSTFTAGTALSLVSFDPTYGTTDVDQNKQIVITFSEDIQAGTNYQGITVRTLSGQGYSITKTINENKLTITGRWTPGTTFEIVIPKNALQDLSGNPNTETYTSTFTASEGPLVTSFDPDSGATDVARDKQIVITFSEDIQAGTNYNAITVRNAATGQGYTLSKSIVGNQLFITGNWTPGTTFEIVIPRNALQDINGNRNANIYTSTFTVATS
jgi:predicted outer membrane repeat protein